MHPAPSAERVMLSIAILAVRTPRPIEREAVAHQPVAEISALHRTCACCPISLWSSRLVTPQLKVCNITFSELSGWRSNTRVANPEKFAGLPSLSLPLALQWAVP